MKAREKKESPWYIDLILCIILIISIVYLFIDYESMIAIDTMSSGKGGKAMALILRYIDNIGGKPLVLLVVFIIVIPFFISTIKKIRRQLEKK